MSVEQSDRTVTGERPMTLIEILTRWPITEEESAAFQNLLRNIEGARNPEHLDSEDAPA